MPGIGLAYKTPEQQAASNFDAGARAVTQPPAAPGIGMAKVAPSEISPMAGPGDVDPTIQPVPEGPPASAPAEAAPAAAPREAPLIDFHKNPLGAIGLVLSATAAGFNGTESPVAALHKQQLEDQAQQYRTASLGMDIIDKTAKFVSKLKPGDRAHAIADLDKRFAPALAGHSIAPFLTAMTAGNEAESTARMEALKGMNISPQMMAYFSQDPDAAVKFIDSYNAHQASRDTPGQKKEDAKAVAEGTNEANVTKPITPAEQAALDVSRGNAATSAASAAEAARHNKVSEDQSNKPMTDAQSNSALFSDRAHQAESVLSDLGGKLGTSRLNRAGDILPNGYKPVSDDFKKLRQAETNFLTAILRKESGASIQPSEFETGNNLYFPQPGDSKELIQQKADTRRAAIAGLARGAGPNYSLPDPLGIRGKK